MFGLCVNFVLFGEKFWTVSVKFLKTFPKFTAGGAVEKRMYLDELPGNTLKLVPVPRPQRTAHVCNTLRRRRGRVDGVTRVFWVHQASWPATCVL